MVNTLFNWKSPPVDANQSWRVSGVGEINVVTVPEEVLKDLRPQDVLALDFLYQSFRSKLKGVILNEENGMNSRLQVSAFLGALTKSFSKQFVIVILTPDEYLPHWHFHLANHAGLKVEVLTADSYLEEFCKETNIALLLSFSNFKLAYNLADYDFFSVVIDSFDDVAHKMVLRRVKGEFNIGLTARNFYTNPNQKLHWTMLNWSNPGVFGKISNFYEVDNENFANFKNSYKTWWFRLTWDFCKTFESYSQKEKSDYQSIIEEWKKTKLTEFGNMSIENDKINGRKRKNKNIIGKKSDEVIKKEIGDSEVEAENDLAANRKEKVVYKSKGKKPLKNIQYGKKKRENDKQPDIGGDLNLNDILKEENSESSTDTIIYEANTISDQNIQNPSLNLSEGEKMNDSEKTNLTSLESDFLLSLVSEPVRKKQRINEKCEELQPTKKKSETSFHSSKFQDAEGEDDDILASFLSNSQTETRKVAENVDVMLECKNSQKSYESVYCRTNLDSRLDSDEESEYFIHSLVSTNNINIGANCSVSETSFFQIRKTKTDKKKLEELLKETENY